MDSDLPCFVVRRAGAWTLTPLPGGNIDLSLEDLLERLAADPPERSSVPFRARVRHVADVGAPPGVRPAPVFATVVHAPHLVTEGIDGTRFLLDDLDVRLIDAVDDYTAVDDLASRFGPTDAAAIHARIARLVDAGALLAPAPPALPGAGSAEGADDPALPAAVPEHDVASEVAAPPAAAPVPVAVVAEGPTADDRIPVYAIWPANSGPLLALGLLTAYARAHEGGALARRFEIRRPETGESFLADIAHRSGPAVLLCSDYVWSLELNLETARAALALNPELVVIHGGPSCPKYEADAARFLDQHRDVAHVLVRGEGELVLARVLEVLAHSLPGIDPEALAAIGGLTFRTDSGEIVRTPDQERISDLDSVPSPYLTGEFDDIEPSSWNHILAIETNRGCPYGCTFCDWGSSTLSRIRKFDLDRVIAEVEWAASHGLSAVSITDANFGIMSRDVEMMRRLTDIKRRTGFPTGLAFFPAKNTTKHLMTIMDLIREAGISSSAALSLQTTDPETLANIDRSNISTDHYVALAADYRRHAHPLIGDVLIGMPGQTVETFRKDLQFMFDHEIMARTWPLQLLPNAPMNAPEYREKFGIVSDDRNLVMSTGTFDDSDRARMLRLRRWDLVCERYGVLRHILRYLQWDHGIEATSVMLTVLDAADAHPDRYPLVAWLVEHFDSFPTVPVGWHAFYDEVVRLLAAELGFEPGPVLETVVQLQIALMPGPGRQYPATTTLAHDYVSYYRDATASLYRDGHSTGASAPLESYPPATFTVYGDPLDLGTYGMMITSDGRSETMQGEFYVGSSVAHELHSPLVRLLPWMGARGVVPDYLGPEGDDAVPNSFDDEPDDHGGAASVGPVPVEIRV